MTVKKKFSHLGFSIVFYLVASNLISAIAIMIAAFIYAFVYYFDAMVAASNGGPAIDFSQTAALIASFRSNSTLINLITACSSYFVAVPLTILVLNTPRFRDVPLNGMQFSTPVEKTMQRNLTPGELINFLLFMFPLGILGSLIGNILALILGSITGQHLNDILTSALSNMSLPMVFLLSVVLAPIFEELVFRYAVIGYIRRYGEWNAIIVSALIFALIHENIFQFFYAFAVGIIFGYVYVYTRKLIYSIILHCTFNFFGAFVPILIDPSFSPTNKASIIYSMIQYIVAIIGFILLINYIRKGKLLETTPGAPIQGKLSKDAILNPGMITLIVVCLIFTVLLMFFT